MEQTSGDTKALWKLLAPHKPKNLTFVSLALLTIITTALELVLPLYSSHLVDSISQEGIDKLLIVGLIVIVLIGAIFEAILSWFGGKVGHRINFNLRYSLIGRLLHGHTENLEKEHSAELSAHVINDSNIVKSVLAGDLIGLLSGLISLVSVVTIMFLLDWRLTLVLLSCVLTGFILITPISLLMNNIGEKTQAAEANLLKHCTEWVRNNKLIKSHNSSESFHQQSQSFLDECYTQEMRETKVLSLIGPIANLVLMMSMIAILAFLAYWLEEGTMTLGTVTAFLLYLFGLTFPLMSMAMFFSNLNKAAGVASRLTEISKISKECTLGSGVQLNKIDNFSFEGLNFERNDKKILTNINHYFSGKGLWFVLGASGSGKSTLLNQLLGFYPETHKQISINGMTLEQYNLSSVRQAFAWVDQEPKLLSSSIRNNLTLGLSEAISDDSLISQLKAVGLDDWLNRINYDLSLTVTEQVNQFSGGEKQRFAIARAMIRKAQVLLLDEPTSALDEKNTAELMNLVRHLSKEIFVIIISHDLDVVAPNDRVIKLESGQLVGDSELKLAAN
ncbi:ABC transporter ATP-binding protein [Parashewanella tropica]|uniref:ABC transporter ATP-binding protein n=1 Tax=Parashewanella tropica TaxID=2547970 RepID=UPI00105A941E|nr:ABC transporter ATP-binding protein [Parashewanella tropica]